MIDTKPLRRAIAKRISGHETDQVFMRYNIVSEKDLAQVMEKRAAYEATLPRERASGEIATFSPVRSR